MEKHRASQNTIKSLINDKKQISGIHNINSHILSFYKDLFHDKTQCNIETCRSFLKDIDTPYLTNEQRKLCEGKLTENEIFDALTGIDNNKLLAVMVLQRNSIGHFGMILKMII